MAINATRLGYFDVYLYLFFDEGLPIQYLRYLCISITVVVRKFNQIIVTYFVKGKC